MPKSHPQIRDIIFSLFLIKFLRKIYVKGAMTKESSSSEFVFGSQVPLSWLDGPEHMAQARGLPMPLLPLSINPSLGTFFMEQDHKKMSVQKQASEKKTVSQMPSSVIQMGEKERKVAERGMPSFTKQLPTQYARISPSY